MAKGLSCSRCNATAKDTSKERKRFLRRHPVLGQCITPAKVLTVDAEQK